MFSVFWSCAKFKYIYNVQPYPINMYLTQNTCFMYKTLVKSV